MNQPLLPCPLTKHKILALQCHITIGRLCAINGMFLQSYPVSIRRPINPTSAIEAIRTLKNTAENLMFDEFSRSKWDSLAAIYSGVNLEELYTSMENLLHDKDNIGPYGIRITNRGKKKPFTTAEYARVWIILQAIIGTFESCKNTFLWAYPTNYTPYNQAGEIISKVKALQEKLQILQQREHLAPIRDDEWQRISNNLNHGSFIFEKATLVIKTDHMIDQEAII